MMRYSEIPRELSTDSVKFPDDESGASQVYRSLRDDSPISDVSSTRSDSGQLISRIIGAGAHKSSDLHYKELETHSKTLPSNVHYKKHCDKKQQPTHAKDVSRRRNNSAGGILPMIHQLHQQHQTPVLTNLHAVDTPSSNGYRNLCSTPPPCTSSVKTQSLPPNTSIKDLDSIILSALRFSPEELAGQITLLDFPAFSAIEPDELTSCAWTKKNKYTVAPNIVAFTKRFNHTSFWTIQEILSGPTPKRRAEIMTHFIKVAKKLHDLNNLHSLFAILSAMQTASIYRLTKTWAQLSKKDKTTFDRLIAIFNDNKNWKNLREYLESLKLPCIPYLGLFLTDLVYIDSAHPHTGGLETEQRRTQMNNIMRIISNYQSSDYSYIQPIAKTQKYIQSIRYIEELQNIFEDDQYKKSLILEPPASLSNSSANKESEDLTLLRPQLDPLTIASLNLSPAKVVAATASISSVSSGSMRLASATKFIPGHRKCRSLGSNIFNKANSQVAPIAATAYCDNGCMLGVSNACYDNSTCQAYEPRHLLDDSLLTNNEPWPETNSSQCGSTDELEVSTECVDEANGDSRHGISGACIQPISFFETDSDHIIQDDDSLAQSNDSMMEGCVRRKTVLKDGRKPAVASWQRYWLQLYSNSLLYFAPKSFKGTARSDFKREPCKMCFLDEWTVQLIDNPQQANTFQLVNKQLGTVYKFRTGSTQLTSLWMASLRRIANAMQPHLQVEKALPVNLMSFE